MAPHNRPVDADTIAAVATAPGRGAIAVLRLSGAAAADVAAHLAGPMPAARHAALRAFVDVAGEPIDRGLVLFFPAPHSYTGEDVVELQGHGGPLVMDLLLRAACAAGARIARPGEFSERAFLNGRIDLAQAEAVADLIDAASQSAARAARRSLDGVFSARVTELMDRLSEIRVHVEGALDFSEEDVDWLADAGLREKLDLASATLAAMLAEASQGRRLNEGITVALAGRPNVGKSTLMNRLAGIDAAIVTPVPGTTRDPLREHIDLQGLPVTLVDTAGLRETTDPIELEGVKRARRAFDASELLLYLVDATAEAGADDRVLGSLPETLPRILVHNKIDLAGVAPGRVERDGCTQVFISATTGVGCDVLVAAVRERAGVAHPGASVFSARSRHLHALETAQTHLQAARRQLHDSKLPELAAEELRLAQDALGEITGRFFTEDLLDRIFAGFCIGK